MKKYLSFLLPLFLFSEEVIIEREVVPVPVPVQPEREVVLEPAPEIFYEMRKSGFLFGVDLTMGEFKTNTIYTPNSFSAEDITFSTMFGVFGGYQFYFDEWFGIRATAHLAGGINNEAQNSVNGSELQNTSTPLWLGVRMSVLWDFLQFGAHALGVSAGVGYEAEFYLNHQYTYQSHTVNASTLIQHNLYPILGIHYYFQNHQFEINYRFSGALNYFSNVTNQGFETQVKYNNFLGFSYAFRF